MSAQEIRAIVYALLAIAFHGSTVAYIWAILATMWLLPIDWDAPLAVPLFKRGDR